MGSIVSKSNSFSSLNPDNIALDGVFFDFVDLVAVTEGLVKFLFKKKMYLDEFMKLGDVPLSVDDACKFGLALETESFSDNLELSLARL